jgi:lipopolysaccharide/colanic/teichoic acid biosynthesis glycosyltransferase
MNPYHSGVLKRLLDITVSLIVLPIALFGVSTGALLIVITTGGPFMYTQPRIGRGGKEFTIYKLRTLKRSASSDLSGMRPNDPDLIAIGLFLRVWRIDELPQILNILLGDMSWVGPRPERPHIVARCLLEIPNYADRHSVRPGITGLAQVNDPDATPEQNAAKLEYDLAYLVNASFGQDLKILWKTVVAIG